MKTNTTFRTRFYPAVMAGLPGYYVVQREGDSHVYVRIAVPGNVISADKTCTRTRDQWAWFLSDYRTMRNAHKRNGGI